jgi:hypothetical protein
VYIAISMGCQRLTYDKFHSPLKIVYGRYQGSKTGSTSKYQWDLIHDPQTMLFAWAQSESEGAIQITDFDYSSNGYGGSEAILNYLYQNRSGFVDYLLDYGLKITPENAGDILRSAFDGEVEILNYNEAYGYLKSLLKYDMLHQISTNKDVILAAIEGISEENSILDKVRENISTETDLLIDLSAETLELISHLRTIYNVTKEIPIDRLKTLLVEDLNSLGKKNLLLTMSNTKFKELLRSSGITKNSDIQELVNIKNTRNNSFFTDIRINRVVDGISETKLLQIVDNTSEFGLVAVARNTENLSNPIYDKSLKLENISKALEITGFAVDLGIALKNIANGEQLEPADLLFFILGAPELIKSAVNNISIEKDIWENELPWEDIKKWNISDYHSNKTKQEEYGIPGHLYLQYTLHRGKANPNIYPTSFIILDENLANDIFGFTPEYVNYNNEVGLNGGSFNPEAQSNKILW